ncbi:MAG: flavin reductase family protein [Acidobacteria bacterium]|nr:flavin reductase family protein [Acidobacteriota bacterium]
MEGTQGYLDCRVAQAYEGGTHTLFLGEVVGLNLDDSRPPLVFYGSRYMGVDSLKGL